MLLTRLMNMYCSDISSDMTHTRLHAQLRADLLDLGFVGPSLQLPHVNLVNAGGRKSISCDKAFAVFSLFLTNTQVNAESFHCLHIE